jgi:hypothetical protein
VRSLVPTALAAAMTAGGELCDRNDLAQFALIFINAGARYPLLQGCRSAQA